MTCFAFRGSDGVHELLCDHLINTYRQASKRWETNVLAKKISRVLSLEDLDEQTVRECILLAALLHDIGKVARKFQRECLMGACESFRQHYLISAFYTQVVLEKTLDLRASSKRVIELLHDGKGRWNELLGVLIVYPIAFHHYHQVQDYTSYNLRDIDFAVHEVCENCFKNLGELIMNEFTVPKLRKVGENLKRLPEILVQDKDAVLRSEVFVSNISKIIKEVVRPKNFLPLAIEAITGIINLCDGIVARSSRRRRESINEPVLENHTSGACESLSQRN